MSAASTGLASTFNYRVVRQFAIMTIVWGIVGMLLASVHGAGTG